MWHKFTWTNDLFLWGQRTRKSAIDRKLVEDTNHQKAMKKFWYQTYTSPPFVSSWVFVCLFLFVCFLLEFGPVTSHLQVFVPKSWSFFFLSGEKTSHKDVKRIMHRQQLSVSVDSPPYAAGWEMQATSCLLIQRMMPLMANTWKGTERKPQNIREQLQGPVNK